MATAMREVTIAEALLVGPARPVPVPVTTVNRQLLTVRVRLLGWSFGETTGAAAVQVRLWDGPSAGGSLLARINIASGLSDAHWTDMLGVVCAGGIFLEVLSGSIEGALYVRTGE